MLDTPSIFRPAGTRGSLRPLLRFELVSILSFCCLCSASDQPSSVDLEICQDGLVVIEGSIGGLKGMRFLVDTGATRTLIDDRVARRLRLAAVGSPRPFAALDRRGHARSVGIPSLEFGPIRVSRMSSLTTDVTNVSAVFGCGRIDAILGLDLLRQSSFEIDYEARRLTFGPIPDEGRSLPFATVVPMLSVDVTVDGQPIRLLLDTAASRLVLFPNRLQARMPRFMLKGRKEIPLAAGSSSATDVELLDVRLGSTPWPRRAFLVDVTSEAYDGLDGVLGGAGVAVKRMGCDFEKNRLRWTVK